MKPVLMRALACEVVLFAMALLAAEAQSAQADLTALQIEDLMNVNVTSASKKEQKLSQVPAAIFVITQEDIRHSGATNIPDLLRMVPGNQQAQLRSQVNLPRHWQWTTSAYFVGRLIAHKIPPYTRLDTNLAWQPSDKISLGLVGQNLVRNLHREYFGPDSTEPPSLIRRSVYPRVTWWF